MNRVLLSKYIFNGCILCDYLLYDFVRSPDPTPPTSDTTPGESRDLYLANSHYSSQTFLLFHHLTCYYTL